MLQRLGLAAALVHEPELLILDEPMSGLDPFGRRDVRELILEQRERGTTILFSSHILPDVEMLCDRVGVIFDGRLAHLAHQRPRLAQQRLGPAQRLRAGLEHAGQLGDPLLERAGVRLAAIDELDRSSVAREVLRSVPAAQREGAYALGATRWEAIRMALYYARTGIIGAVMLGFGRALGETMAVTMVIGNTPQIKWSLYAPQYTMAAVIANEFTEAADVPDFTSEEVRRVNELYTRNFDLQPAGAM